MSPGIGGTAKLFGRQTKYLQSAESAAVFGALGFAVVQSPNRPNLETPRTGLSESRSVPTPQPLLPQQTVTTSKPRTLNQA